MSLHDKVRRVLVEGASDSLTKASVKSSKIDKNGAGSRVCPHFVTPAMATETPTTGKTTTAETPSTAKVAHTGAHTCLCEGCKEMRTLMMSIDPGCSVPPYISPEERARDREAAAAARK